MFKLLGALLAAYVVLCVLHGRVHARRGLGGETIVRDDAPGRFWTAIVVYSALTIALFTVF